MIHSSIHNDGMFRLLTAIAPLRLALGSLRGMSAVSPNGITEVLGPALYVNVHGYETRPRHRCAWESHRHTADVQFCISGGECIDWLEGSPRIGSSAYDPERDFETWQFNEHTYRTLSLTAGEYVVFLPGELHRPMIVDSENKGIRKAVVKIDATLLAQVAADKGGA